MLEAFLNFFNAQLSVVVLIAQSSYCAALCSVEAGDDPAALAGYFSVADSSTAIGVKFVGFIPVPIEKQEIDTNQSDDQHNVAEHNG